MMEPFCINAIFQKQNYMTFNGLLIKMINILINLQHQKIKKKKNCLKNRKKKKKNFLDHLELVNLLLR